MTGPGARERLDREGAAAPPRRNGELVFEAPWESRAFGLALSLCDAGAFTWEEFRAALIGEIADWEARASADEPYSYYARWQAALERVLAGKDVCSGSELEDRVGAYAARPHGHDHTHNS